MIETFTGRWFDYDEPTPEMVCVEDIAHALAHTCRYGGHAKHFYSVAEHAVLVRELVVSAGRSDLALAALHHDDAEAYLGDVPKPLKRHLQPHYGQLTERVDKVVAEALDLNAPQSHHPVIKAADVKALRIETAQLKVSMTVWTQDGLVAGEQAGRLLGLTPDAAKSAFLAAHEASL